MRTSREFVLVSLAVFSLVVVTLSARNCIAQQADHFESGQIHQSPSIKRVLANPEGFPADPDSNALTLETLHGMALTNNPTLAQAQAQVEAAAGAAYQAGLPPNPNVGYVAEQIGINGTAGELQGGFVSQEFVRGNKLGLSRAKYCQRLRIAETNLAAQQARVRNDVAIRFYRCLASQRVLELHQQFVETANDNVQTHKEMLNMGQLGEAEVLQAEVDLQREHLKFNKAQNDLEQTWRELMSFVGAPEVQITPLSGALETQQAPLDWDSAVSQLLGTSPQLISAQQKIQHDQIAVERERVEPVPNLTVDVSVGYNAEVDQTVTGVSAGFALPVFNRNRGTIRQANADLDRSYAEVRRLESELQTELSKQFRDYISAWQHIQEYQQTMIPKSRSALEKLEQSYKDRRAPWTSVLSAKRMLLELELEQIDNWLAFQTADVAIRGNLLLGGLTEPEAPISGGHIDAVAQPR